MKKTPPRPVYFRCPTELHKPVAWMERSGIREAGTPGFRYHSIAGCLLAVNAADGVRAVPILGCLGDLAEELGLPATRL